MAVPPIGTHADVTRRGFGGRTLSMSNTARTTPASPWGMVGSVAQPPIHEAPAPLVDATLVARCPRCRTLSPVDAARCASCGVDFRFELVELVEVATMASPERGGRRTRHLGRRLRSRWGRRRVPSVAMIVALAAMVVGMAAVAVAGRQLRPCRPRPTGAAFSRPLLDRCTATRLVLRTAVGLRVLDVDAGRFEDLPRLSTAPAGQAAGPSGGPVTDAVSDGRVVVVHDGVAWSVPLGRGRPRGLGPAQGVLSDGAGGWWIISGSDVHGVVGAVARRVRGRDRQPGAPLYLSSGVAPVGGVAGGLVVRAGTSGLTVVGAARPVTLRTDLRVERVLVAGARHVLVLGAHDGEAPALWTVPFGPGPERRVGQPARSAEEEPSAGAAPEAGAKVAPDGRHLAVFTSVTSAGGFRNVVLVVVDVATGTIQTVPGGGTAAAQPSLAWSPDGRWVFFLQAGGPADRTLGAYRFGDHAAEALRLYPPAFTDMVGVDR